ncbi:MAG: hypothetical protein ACE5RO_06525 [Candidatus Nitrosomaritimum yanchengensis]
MAKESIEIIYENIMTGESKTIEEAMKNASIETINQMELEEILEKIVKNNKEIIENQKERSVGPLMGIAMKELRGKASGEIINTILLQKIKNALKK